VRSQDDSTTGRQPLVYSRIAFDITDLKQTEKELQEERNVVSGILDTVGALVVVLDREGRIVRFNRACEQMTGKSFEEARGQTIWDLFMVPHEQEQFKRLFQRIEDTQSRTEYESSLLAKDGRQRTIAWSSRCSSRGEADANLHHRIGYRCHRAEADASQISRPSRSRA
jgi:PAS domain S-box-containing protein